MILFVFGTRPEAIKIGAVVAELAPLNVPYRVICTGQHTSLLKGTPAEGDLVDARSLGLPSHGNTVAWLETAVPRIRSVIGELEPAAVVVQGDTMSALAGARAASDLRLTLAHIEAGVRSHDLDNPWPEEGYRKEITTLADWHYTPTTTAFANLIQEGVPPARILVTGNPVVSALARYTNAHPSAAQPQILFTMHRREWLRSSHVTPVLEMLAECARAYADVAFVWPMHPIVQASAVPIVWPENVRRLAPLPYRQTATILAASLGVMTDSGGLQEEAAALGVPCAVLRTVTDRPESVEAGVARVFPPIGEGLRTAVMTLIAREIPRRVVGCFGDTTAAAQVARALARLGQGRYVGN